MGVKVYDSTSQAFVDATPKVQSGGAWTDAVGKQYNNGAWVDDFPEGFSGSISFDFSSAQEVDRFNSIFAPYQNSTYANPQMSVIYDSTNHCAIVDGVNPVYSKNGNFCFKVMVMPLSMNFNDDWTFTITAVSQRYSGISIGLVNSSSLMRGLGCYNYWSTVGGYMKAFKTEQNDNGFPWGAWDANPDSSTSMSQKATGVLRKVNGAISGTFNGSSVDYNIGDKFNDSDNNIVYLSITFELYKTTPSARAQLYGFSFSKD